MSLSFNSGRPIAQSVNIKTGEIKTIYLNNDETEDDESEEDLEDMINKLLDEGYSQKEVYKKISMKTPKGIKEIIAGKDEIVMVLPSEKTERVFMAGRSQMGKSTLAKNYMIEYRNINPKNEIFLISRHEDDPVYDAVIKGISHIVVDKELMECEMNLDDLRDSLVVFDDVDNLQDSKISKWIHQLVDDLISNGAKYGITVLYLGHQLSNYSKTRNITNEANKVFFFPGTSTYHVKEFLQKKMGIDKPVINKILNLKTRWACLNVMMPYNVIYEGGVFVI